MKINLIFFTFFGRAGVYIGSCGEKENPAYRRRNSGHPSRKSGCSVLTQFAIPEYWG